jgi:excisionase family DNA binding protein
MKTKTSIEPLLVSKRDAAQALGVSVRTLEYLVSMKRIIARRVGRRTLIPYRSLQEFARRDTPTIEKSSGGEVSHGQ